MSITHSTEEERIAYKEYVLSYEGINAAQPFPRWVEQYRLNHRRLSRESSERQDTAQALSQEGVKYDDGKVRYDLLPLDAIDEISAVLTFGAKKYADRNWERGMRWGRLYRAALGHLFSWWKGEEADPETGLSHLAHAACCVIFLLSYSLRNGHIHSETGNDTEYDDRPLRNRNNANA